MDWDIAVPATRLNVRRFHHIYSPDYLEWVHKQRVTEAMQRKLSTWTVEISRRIDPKTDRFTHPITSQCVAEGVEIKYG